MPNIIETQEDRIRAVFSLPPHAALPPVSKDTLPQYHEYLAGKLSFPFQALYIESTPPVKQLVRYVTVVGLSDSLRRRMFGLFCKVQVDETTVELPLAELGLRDEDPNCQLVDDYCQWLWSSR